MTACAAAYHWRILAYDDGSQWVDFYRSTSTGHDPYAYLKDVLTRLPPQRASEIEQLLPHKWVKSLD
nr:MULTISPECIES: transposase domain-containing protein [Pseudomonas syringae group]